MKAALLEQQYAADGWVEATAFVDVRPITADETDAFLRPGETYVFVRLRIIPPQAFPC